MDAGSIASGPCSVRTRQGDGWAETTAPPAAARRSAASIRLATRDRMLLTKTLKSEHENAVCRTALMGSLGTAAEPVIRQADARTPAGLKLLVELAEVTGAGVIDQQRRMNFPSRHPLNQTQRSRAADPQ